MQVEPRTSTAVFYLCNSVGKISGYPLLIAVFLADIAVGAQVARSDFTTEIYRAKAYKEGTKEVLYYEYHEAKFDKNNRIVTSATEYLDDKDKLLATLDSDYTKSLTMPTYLFADYRRGTSEGLKFKDENYYIFSIDTTGQVEEKKLEETEGIFSCQGWHYYIVKNLATLKSKPLDLKLIFPAKMDYYAFELKETEDTQSLLKLRLEFSNWFLSIFAPHLDLVYDKKSAKIISYTGPSNLLDAKGKIQYVDVIYNRSSR